MNTIIITVAAGSGSRFGDGLPKQFHMLNGSPVIVHTLRRLNNACPDAIQVLVLHADFIDYWEELTKAYPVDFEVKIVAGGASRWESVNNAIKATSDYKADIIMVHDGARPMVTPMIIQNLQEACQTHDGAIPTVAVTDSLRHITGRGLSEPVNRAEYRAVQTPQAFNACKLRKAYDLPYQDAFTDDASVMAAAGYNDVTLTEGDSRNIKITLPGDIEIAALYMRSES